MNAKTRTLGQAIDTAISALAELSEQQQRTALLAILSELGLGPNDLGAWSRTPSNPTPEAQTGEPNPQYQLEPQARIDIRSLREQKGIRSAKDMACLVAYYLKDVAPSDERKDTVSAIDMEKYFKQAAYKLPSRLPQLLIDAKQAGFFESVARGEYRLNTVGYNRIVHDLPERTGRE